LYPKTSAGNTRPIAASNSFVAQTRQYCGAVGMLSYLGNSVHPDIQMAVHQTARFSVNPMKLQKSAIMCIGQYLCNNCGRRIIYNVDKSNGIEVYVDADFAKGWSSADADNADNILSWTGFCYMLCKLSFDLVQQSPDQDYFINCRSRIYCNVTCSSETQFQFKTLPRKSVALFFYPILLHTFALWFMKTAFLLY
jgi:hypothetical protein